MYSRAVLILGLALGVAAWLVLHFSGLAASGLTRDVFWGLLSGQSVFFGNAGAGALVLLLLYCLYVRPAGERHSAERFTAAGLFAAACSLFAGALFLFAALGQPRLLLNLVLRPSPSAMFFWLALLLPLCLLLGAGLGRAALKRWSLRLQLPGHFRAFMLLGLTLGLAFLLAQALYFQSFPGRGYWQNAGLSVRLWASAFSAGAALLLLVWRALPGAGRDGGRPKDEGTPERFLSAVLGLALSLNLLFFFLELYAAFYGGDVWLARSYQALFLGVGGRVYWFNFLMWLSAVLTLGAAALFLLPGTRKSRSLLPLILGMVLLSGWLDKSLALPLGGLLPGAATRPDFHYTPSFTELFLSLGVWSAALLLYRMLGRAPAERF